MRSVENDHRNVIQVNGFSSSQRATGRGCSDAISMHDHNPATLAGGEQVAVQRLLVLADSAREAYVRARSSRALQKLLSERTRPEARSFSIGEAVFYRRPKDPTGKTKKGVWLGPGVVAAVVAALTSDVQHYKINHGGS